MTNILLLHPISSTAVPGLQYDLLCNLSGCNAHYLRRTGWRFMSEISTSNYRESMCQSHMLINTRLYSLFKTSITHVEFLGYRNSLYRWMWSTSGFLPFPKCFGSALPTEPWLQKPLGWETKVQDAVLTRTKIHALLPFLERIQGQQTTLFMEKGSADFPIYLVVNLIRHKHAVLKCCGHEGRVCSEVILWDGFIQCISSRGEN